ncbi:MAG: AmmeMemoRadiSam system protein B [Candidatus Omnitrophica bacterium]|nr:AmmeMemoRadiSam system protein B [Candidatus Omnitrophota bacterium]MDD5352625.1 AmmeMemoRadiSam system protein B [Candidatus Omnitrophota bacterium]MDD5550224.1 AmmeMemoRadiSam system protein B [Candidatus Omnitrophota bacterium]
MKKIFLSGFICFVLFCGIIFAEGKIKYPNVSGQFYPADKDVLSSQIDNFFANVRQNQDVKDKDILAVISPHAGYAYSGQVAAYSFDAIKGRSFDTVIILAPSHFYALKGISVYDEGFFRTPLGDVEVDSELTKALISSSDKIKFIPEAFEREHAVEVELPFLQKSLAGFKIVPMVFGQLDYSDYAKVARILVDITKGKKVLLVASTDLSHYHPYSEAQEMDAKAISYMKNLDAFGFWQSNLKRECEACGLAPVSVLLNYAKELGLKAQALDYANSGDVTGDKSGVVGYASIIFFKESSDLSEADKNNSGKNSPVSKGEEQMFNETQKKRLLEIARQTITEYVVTGKTPSFNEEDPQLNLQRGAFVTLHKDGDLRGCIGTFTSREPIYKVISQMAIESATGDPRFGPVTKDELSHIKIEISVLTEPQLIDDWRKIRLGTDGVIVKRGFSSGVFLPQVATETKWDLETFLSQLCWQKAGLAPDAYKDSKTQIYTFQAFVFSEG